MIALLLAVVVAGTPAPAPYTPCTLHYAPTADEWYGDHTMGFGYKTCKTMPDRSRRRGLQ